MQMNSIYAPQTAAVFIKQRFCMRAESAAERYIGEVNTEKPPSDCVNQAAVPFI